MANTFYITAGLPVGKDADQDPSAGVNTVYVSAGLVPEELPDSGGGASTWIWARQHSSQVIGGGAL